jgi:hypothetical protein
MLLLRADQEKGRIAFCGLLSIKEFFNFSSKRLEPKLSHQIETQDPDTKIRRTLENSY